MDGANSHRTGPSIAIIGGGCTGAALALHLAAALPACRLLIFEPRPVIGPGLAYSTADPAHRLNAPAQRMSLYPDDPAHFQTWIAATKACLDDPDAALPDGRLFPRRAIFGAYAAAQLAPLLESGRLIHHRQTAENLTWQYGAWTITTAHATLRANTVILATGNTPPAIPAALAPITAAPNFIRDPLRPGALAGITPKARLLILGTGLTMADIAASLDQAGHTGPIQAISRRGQSPRPQSALPCAPLGDFSSTPVTALALIRHVRAAVAAAGEKPWQAVFDAVRLQAQTIWQALPVAERCRLIRHARPFWDCHRHRLPPATFFVLRRRLDCQSLTITAGFITASAPAGGKIAVTLRRRGEQQARRSLFDSVILAAGPGGPAEQPGILLANLLRSGLVRVDSTGLGLTCGAPHLYLAGPLTRGTFGEITAIPEITRQAAAIAQRIAAEAMAKWVDSEPPRQP